MKYCINHPGKKAEYVCHSCGINYCTLCLTESGDYYYCNEPECQKLLKTFKTSKIIPSEIVCPNCSAELNADVEEQETGIINCPDCESLIDFTIYPPAIKDRKEYTQIFSSFNQADIGIVKSILDDGNIDYYVFGENFLSIDPMIQPARFFISNDQIEEAKELLKDFDFNFFGASTKKYDED